MNHIFYLHSNTCVVSSFELISSLVGKNESVIVITERNIKFPFFNDSVKKYDMQAVINKYRKNTNNVLSKVINYRTRLHPHCKQYAEQIINHGDFILYTPSYNMYTIKPFVNSRFCKGYYFIEEGYLSYLSQESLVRNYRIRRYKKGRILMDFVGAGETLDYKRTKKFMGCYGLSEYSFPWCNNNKHIVGFDGYFSNIPYDDINADALIITDFLNYDESVIKNAFLSVVKQIVGCHSSISGVAIKFHPTAMVNKKDLTERIVNYVQEQYPNVRITVLPASYSVEALMYHRKIDIYCILGVSSLLLYALMFGSRPYRVIQKNQDIIINEINSIPNYFDIIKYQEY